MRHFWFYYFAFTYRRSRREGVVGEARALK
jgi:hypothetical protein